MEVDKNTAKKLKGRGEVKLNTMKPQIKTQIDKEKNIRNKEMRKATEYLRQARRCEQVNHRIERGRKAEPEMKEKYEVLNKEAISLIMKHLDPKDEKDKEFKAKSNT